MKGSCTFTAQSAVVEDHETEEDSGSKPNGEKEAEPSAEEDMEVSGKVGGTDQSLGYISGSPMLWSYIRKRTTVASGVAA